MEPWANLGHHREQFATMIHAALLICAILSLFIPVIFTETRKLSIGILGVFLTILFAYSVMITRATMPFCVYERGVTRRRVSMSAGWARQESFVSWGEISSLSRAVWREGGGKTASDYLSVRFVGGGSMTYLFSDREEWDRFVGILVEHAPERLTLSLFLSRRTGDRGD